MKLKIDKEVHLRFETTIDYDLLVNSKLIEFDVIYHWINTISIYKR